ncbi:L,D-transpeptidase [Rhizobium sp. SSA_523]|uniref:L,D-transpeptidase n=1 Tax=Rhizobium sp. SSA_523 TaxID=2952477 RepID=UPI0020902F4E|nr:L,D-transpeptidase [Rhizobium sp. SSA_523]MCO5730966.1 L,D-transpeptidase [Rhizobium sp. SSA_523]WKC24226.1 L,D-transpeptidase [Rhizobium sp. SSA_523]
MPFAASIFTPALVRRCSLAALFSAIGTLSGCILVTDTSRMNPDVFVRETSPVFLNPVYATQLAVQPQPVPQREAIPQKRELYQTQFHQTYGIPVANPVHRIYYQSVRDDGHTLPAIPYSRIDARYLRQEVDYRTSEAPGTLVVDTRQRFLYLVQPNGKAIRYGIGIGRDGFAWSGRGVIQWKAKWPRWTPPADMVARQPELARFSAAEGGALPGLNNPLGARALYIFKGGKDTLYRVHGTPDWQSIGKATSSGCVRLLNQDVIDLYERVPSSTPIVVL